MLDQHVIKGSVVDLVYIDITYLYQTVFTVKSSKNYPSGWDSVPSNLAVADGNNL